MPNFQTTIDITLSDEEINVIIFLMAIGFDHTYSFPDNPELKTFNEMWDEECGDVPTPDGNYALSVMMRIIKKARDSGIE